LKIVKIRITSFVFLLRWGWDAQAYYLPHRVGDTMPNSMEMSDYGSTFIGSPMLGEAQFCVPKNNLHQIKRNTLTSELKKKKPRARLNSYVEENTRLPSGGAYHSRGGSSTVTRLSNGSRAVFDASRSLVARGWSSSHNRKGLRMLTLTKSNVC
jgi:hypothetical protein